MLSKWLITVSANCDHLNEMVFFRFLHYKVTLSVFPSCHPVLCGRHHYCISHLRDGELCSVSLRGNSYIKYLKFFCMGDLSVTAYLPIYYLFVQRLIYTSVDSWLFILHVGYNLMLFIWLRLFQFFYIQQNFLCFFAQCLPPIPFRLWKMICRNTFKIK